MPPFFKPMLETNQTVTLIPLTCLKYQLLCTSNSFNSLLHYVRGADVQSCWVLFKNKLHIQEWIITSPFHLILAIDSQRKLEGPRSRSSAGVSYHCSMELWKFILAEEICFLVCQNQGLNCHLVKWARNAYYLKIWNAVSTTVICFSMDGEHFTTGSHLVLYSPNLMPGATSPSVIFPKQKPSRKLQSLYNSSQGFPTKNALLLPDKCYVPSGWSWNASSQRTDFMQSSMLSFTWGLYSCGLRTEVNCDIIHYITIAQRSWKQNDISKITAVMAHFVYAVKLNWSFFLISFDLRYCPSQLPCTKCLICKEILFPVEMCYYEIT